MKNVGLERNLFSRLFRRGLGEDHLTESLAVLCERSSIFTAEVANIFAPDLAKLGTLRIATQSPYRLGATTKFIDFEIWAEQEDGQRAATAFVEVKWQAGEHSSTGSDNTVVNQNRNYEEILWNERGRLGAKVGLFSLTPAFNPLQIEIDPMRTDLFLPTRNVFWSQVGKLADRVRRTADDAVFQYLAENFIAYLMEAGLMSDSRLTIQDVFIASQYMRVRKKLWPALQRVAEHLGKSVNSGAANSNSFATASTQEFHHNRFCVCRSLVPETGLGIFAGLIPDDTEGAWVSTWIEVNPRYGEQFDAVSAAVKQAFPDYATKSGDSPEANRWVLSSRGSGWFIATKRKRLASYVQGEDGVEVISSDLIAWVDELLSIKNLASLAALPTKKAG